MKAILTLLFCLTTFLTQLTFTQAYFAILLHVEENTQLKIYQWNPIEGNLPNVTLFSTETITPGLVYFRDHGGLQRYMESIVVHAEQHVPIDLWYGTPFYVLWSGEVRQYNDSKSLEMLEGIRTALSNPETNPFIFRHDHVRILSYEKEMAYLWVVVNHLNGFFDKNKDPPLEKPYGIFNFGLRSLRYAFANEISYDIDGHRVEVLGKTYGLNVMTDISSGFDYFYRRFQEVAIENYDNPCSFNNINEENDEGEEITASMNREQCPGVITNQVYKTKFRTDNICREKPCKPETLYIPNLNDTEFYALNGIAFTAWKSQTIDVSSKISLGRFLGDGVDFCENYKGNEDDKKTILLRSTCMAVRMYKEIFTQVFNFNNDKTFETLFEKPQADLGWTKGAMLLHLSRDMQYHKVSSSSTLSISTLLVSTIISMYILKLFTLEM